MPGLALDGSMLGRLLGQAGQQPVFSVAVAPAQGLPALVNVIGCLAEEHDLRLVVLAALICAVASFTTLNLVARAQVAARRLGWALLFAAAGVFGGGVWSLHFVAMLAYKPHLPIGYDVATTASSVAIAGFGALLGLLAWRRLRSRPLGVLSGGTLLGLSVAGMHYTGVAAMRLPGSMALDPAGVAASVLIGIGFATLSLARSDKLDTLARRAEVSGWLAMAVCGLHFTGMSALAVTPGLGPAQPGSGTVLGSGLLAAAVGLVSLGILLLGLTATIVERHLWQRAVEAGRLRRLAGVVREGILIHRNGRILEVNEALCRLLGQSPGTLIGRHVSELVAPGSAETVAGRVNSTRDDLPAAEVELRTRHGTVIPVEIVSQSFGHEGKPARAVAIRDLSDRRRDEARIRHLAHHDALTGLPNRFLLHERLTHALEVAARSSATVAVLCLDLDHFKPVNDALGHAGGDNLLGQVSRRLLDELRATDTLARTGGDEFVIVLPMADQPQAAATLAQRVVERLACPFDLDGRQVGIGVSVGISLFPGDGDDQDTLLRKADLAMYRAKQGERGSFCFFEAAMDEQLHQRSLLEQDLRRAVDRGEMEVHYQPLVDARTGKVDGFEALLRWRHPQRGMIPPQAFIPLAEETGLIARLGQWALDTACAEAAGWTEPFRIAVNLSPVQFRQAGLPQAVADTLARTGLAPGRLDIEVTEGVLIDDAGRATAILAALQAQGVGVVLDDFGTGYSSLSYLHSFRFAKLKIDKSFVQALGRSEETVAIVRAIIGLGHNLALSVTAEGVETQAQLDMLRELGCDQVQGFLLGRPAPQEQLSELTVARARSPITRNAAWRDGTALGERKDAGLTA